MVNTTYNSTEGMIKNLQSLNGKTKVKFYKNPSNFYNIMDLRMDEDHFARNAQGISKIYHDVLSLLKLSQNKPEVRSTKFNYYDLYYTVIKNRDEKKIVNDTDENDYNNFDVFLYLIKIYHVNFEKQH